MARKDDDIDASAADMLTPCRAMLAIRHDCHY